MKKSGASEPAASASTGITIDLSSLDPPVAPSRRGGTGPVGGSSASRTAPAAAKPLGAGSAIGRSSQPPAAGKGNGANRIDVDDPFGMAELTGEAGPRSAPASSANKSGIDFDGLDLVSGDEPLLPAKPKTGPLRPDQPITSKPKTGPQKETSPRPKTGPQAAPPKPTTGPVRPEARPKTGPVKDSSGLELDESAFEKKAGGSLDLSLDEAKPPTKPRTDKHGQSGKQYKSIFQKPAEPPPSARRELVSSALTGLVGAALAMVVVIVAAVSDEGSAGWLGFHAGSDVVATRVVSGLYDTAAGKPVFYVRGRVENRGRKHHGPVRVVAELVADGETEAKAEAIAGAEPNPEDVYGLRSPAEADKLQRMLLGVSGERRLPPGASLPFFAVITDPPPDLNRHRLHLKLEPIDAWAPPRSAAAAK